MTVTPEDVRCLELQLGREVRGVVGIGHRCHCGNPDVVVTAPRLPDGTPFPTVYYLTCPRASSAIGTLEADGVMRDLQQRLDEDDDLAAGYARAHEMYLAARHELGDVAEIAGISAGGMPTRVKCLHVLAAHALAAGSGVNPLGDIVLEMIGDYSAGGTCVERET